MIRILAVVFLFAILVGCANNYEMKETGGKLYRLNKRTGDIDLVNGISLVRLQKIESSNNQQALQWARQNPDDPRSKEILERLGFSGTLVPFLATRAEVLGLSNGAHFIYGGKEYIRNNKNKSDSLIEVEAVDSFPLQCRLPIGTQVDGWFYKGGNEADKNDWIPDTILTDKQIEAQPWKLFKQPDKAVIGSALLGIDTICNGYRFVGGEPSDSTSWVEIHDSKNAEWDKGSTLLEGIKPWIKHKGTKRPPLESFWKK